MPSLVVKPEPDQDFYVVWSMGVDNVTYAGTREELQRGPAAADLTDERFERADTYGTSARPDGEMAGCYGWDHENFVVKNDGTRPGFWWLPRGRLRAYVEGDESVLEPLDD